MRSIAYGLIGCLIAGVTASPQSVKAQVILGYATPAYYYPAYPGYLYGYRYYYPSSYVLVPTAPVAYTQPTVTVGASAAPAATTPATVTRPAAAAAPERPTIVRRTVTTEYAQPTVGQRLAAPTRQLVTTTPAAALPPPARPTIVRRIVATEYFQPSAIQGSATTPELAQTGRITTAAARQLVTPEPTARRPVVTRREVTRRVAAVAE